MLICVDIVVCLFGFFWFLTGGASRGVHVLHVRLKASHQMSRLPHHRTSARPERRPRCAAAAHVTATDDADDAEGDEGDDASTSAAASVSQMGLKLTPCFCSRF